MATRKTLALHMADAFHAADWTAESMVETARRFLTGVSEQELATLVSYIRRCSVTPYAPPPEDLKYIIEDSRYLAGLLKRGGAGLADDRPILSPAKMAPLETFKDLALPHLATPADLAAWLNVPLQRLPWFADLAGRLAQHPDGALQHYSFSWQPKRRGAPRLIEAPKPELKRLQRKILREILDPVPLHDAALGFRKGHSCLDHAQRHAGEQVVVAVDLKDFFLSVPLARVHGIFRCLGYPWAVARLLTGLCCTVTPRQVFAQLPQGQQPEPSTKDLCHGLHLPQGAPTSPALANLCAWRLDRRLSGLARHLDAGYSRYADDIAFSGDEDLARRQRALLASITAIAAEEHFRLNPGKTRVMRHGQRQVITGLIVNRHLNLPRGQFDALKATLHNCRRFGPRDQNRDGHPDFRRHLDGRVTWMENVNPGRGEKLRQIFDQIVWT